MKILGWAVGEDPPVEDREQARPDGAEHRSEPRHDCRGLKLIIRKKRALGILHLDNVSSCGACGITDLPLAVGALAFLELKKGHFYAARVMWARNLTIGFQFARQMRPETLNALLHRKELLDRGQRSAA